MPKFGSLGKFFGRTVGEGAAYAAGVATAPTLAPALEELRQTTWNNVVTKTGISKRLDAETAAAIVAEDVELTSWGTAEANHEGISADRFAALLGEALNAPGLGELYSLWRRGEIDDAGFTHGLRKAKLETRWDAPLKALKAVRYSAQEIALGVVRSVIRDPGWMVETLDTSGSNVPQYQPVDIDPVAEAAASGFTSERMRGLVGEIGLPMSAQQAASALFRGIITHGAYNQAILEGDTRPEWAPFILEQARQIASAADYVNARLRGWISDDDMYAGAARHGMSREDTQLLFLIHGRPAAPGQMATASFRGIDGPDGRPMDRDQFLKGIAESDIRPEWGEMLWESRYHYPPLFQLSRLVQGGAIDVATAVDWSHKAGLAPEVVDALERYWSKPSATTDKEATAADWLTLYDGGKATEAETLTALKDLGYPADEAQRKVQLVAARKVASAKSATATALGTDYRKGKLSADAVQAALVAMGIDAVTASAMLDMWAQYIAAEAQTQTQ